MPVRYLIHFFALLLSFSVSGQQQQQPQQSAVIPPSPEAASLGKYGVYPVNLSTGLVNISIPLYTIQSSQLQVPISLSYHASGIKVDEVSSRIGIGWSLNAGGVVTRSVRGKTDDGGGGYGFLNKIYKTQSQINAMTNAGDIYNYLNDVNTSHDNESDVYSYNANGISGTFRYAFDPQTGARTLVQQPYTDNIITLLPAPQVGYQIVTPEGVTYIFKDIEVTVSNGSSFANTSFYLTDIISADKTDVIHFEYVKDGSSNGDRYETSLYEQGVGYSNYQGHIQSTVQYQDVRILSKITFSNGSVVFQKAGDRKDRRKYRFSQIDVFNTKAELLQSFRLQQDYFVTNSPLPPDYTNPGNNYHYRLRLDGVEMLDKAGQLTSSYALWYNTSVSLPPYLGAANNAYYGQDLYGYYNGITSNDDFLVEGVQSPSNRNVSTSHAQAGTLTAIRYPTGGLTQFTYESNTCGGAPTGGLRIQTVASYTSSDQSIPALVKTYSYDGGSCAENNYKALSGTLNSYQQGYVTTGDGGHSYKAKTVYTSSPVFPLGYGSGNISFYGSTTERSVRQDANGITLESLGRTEYDFENDPDDSYATNVTMPFTVQFPPRFSTYYMDRSWHRGNLKETRVYNQADGLLKRTTNTYQTFKEATYYTGNYVHRNYLNEPSVWIGSDAQTARTVFQFFDLKMTSGIRKLIRTIETNYSASGQVSQQTDYFYDAIGRSNRPHQQVNRTRTRQSDGSLQYSAQLYPSDYASGTPTLDQLVSGNLLNRPVESIQYRQNADETQTRILGGELTLYEAGGNGRVAERRALESIMPLALVDFKFSNVTKGSLFSVATPGTFNPDSRYQSRLLYERYDAKGNPLRVRSPHGIATCYQWGYQNSYPIAKIVNTNMVLEAGVQNPAILGDRSITSPTSIANGFQRFGTEINLNMAQTLRFTLVLSDPSTGGYPGGLKIEIGVMNSAGVVTTTGTDPYFDSYGTYELAIGNLALGKYNLAIKMSDYPSGSTKQVKVHAEGTYQFLNNSQYYFHTSFEDEQYTSTDDAKAQTGKKSHTGSFQLPIAPPTGQYILSYWQKPSLADANWTYMQQPITGNNTQPSINVASTIVIDEVRLHPVESQMTTYTYDPLIGITSATDQANVTTYYEYDNLHRLKRVKDKDRNIIKHYVYHYKE